MENVENIKELLQFLNSHCEKTSRLCFKDNEDKNNNLIYGIDRIDVDNEKTEVKLIVNDSNKIQDPYSFQDLEEKIHGIDDSYYIQVVKIEEMNEDSFFVGMTVFDGSFRCNVKSEKRFVMYCV